MNKFMTYRKRGSDHGQLYFYSAETRQIIVSVLDRALSSLLSSNHFCKML